MKLGLSVTGDLTLVTVHVLFGTALGLFSVVETVRLGLSPPTGLGDATLAVVTLCAGSTMIPDRLARIFATSCLSAGVRAFPFPGDTPETVSLP